MKKRLLRFYLTTILSNKLMLLRIAIIFGLLLLFTLALSLLFGSEKDRRYEKRDIDVEISNYESAIKDYKYDMEDYSSGGYFNTQNYSNKYDYKKSIAELEFCIRERKYYSDYYDLTKYFETCPYRFNAANRLMSWQFFSTMILSLFAICIPISFSNNQDMYKNILVADNKMKDVMYVESIVQYAALVFMSIIFTIIGSFVGFGSHKIMVLQYNNGNAVAVSCYLIFLIKQLLALISSCTLLALSNYIYCFVKNKLFYIVLLLTIFIVPMIIFSYYALLPGFSCLDGGAAIYPFMGLFWTEWVVGNYKLIPMSLLYIAIAYVLIWLKVKKFEKSK